MENRQKLFLALSLITIFFLLFLSTVIQPQQLAISDITKTNLNQFVKVAGKITSQRNYEGKDFQVLVIKDKTDSIQVTTNAKNKIELNYSLNYTIIGTVTEYNQTLQISANKIEAI